ncbi:protein phosphatase 2C domain-containing protein [Parachlamydia sp. AcF125]|uniref:protein phosphatase 2C domain-containing protein n=1 Tax=Parachlamydia sp. AcF125 TaxID=2795736 RepID=UPI001BCA4DD0|nr:protein phosphatase 2C domain-containing protein [Parachlamydia sp. AcF125]MBS4168028.1 hypothetical protein [Parachlamydia sp. AcF125]
MSNEINSPSIRLGNKEFTVKEIESSISGNFWGRTINRIILGITKGVWVNKEKVAANLKNLNGNSLDSMYKVATSNTFKGLIANEQKTQSKRLQSKKIAILGKLGSSTALLKRPEELTKIVEHILPLHTEKPEQLAKIIEHLAYLKDLPRGPALAIHKNKLVWVRKDNEGWQIVRPFEREKVEVQDLKFIDLETTEFNILQNGLATHIKGKEYTYTTDENHDYTSMVQALNELKEKFASLTHGHSLRLELDQFQKITTLDDSLQQSESQFVANKDEKFVHSQNDDTMKTTAILQAKGYLPQNEFCADWVAIDRVGSIDLAIVADAAGNKESSHVGSVELTNLFREILTSRLINQQENGILSLDNIVEALTQAMLRTELTTMCEGSMGVASTMACTLIIPYGEKRYAVGFCLGDARVMLKRQDGSAKDLSPTPFSSTYKEAGAFFGMGIESRRGKHIQPIFQELESGDTILLGSDGFGDNMEAKTLGKTPSQALQELKEANKLERYPELKALAENPEEWILQATSPAYWIIDYSSNKPEDMAIRNWQNMLNNESKKLLQTLHTLYSEHVLEEMSGDEIAFDIYNHCTQSPLVKMGSFVNEMAGKEIDKKSLEKYKEFAVQLTGKARESEELSALFSSWDTDPKKAHQWLEYRAGKSDDFSLIALTMK